MGGTKSNMIHSRECRRRMIDGMVVPSLFGAARFSPESDVDDVRGITNVVNFHFILVKLKWENHQLH